MSCSVLNLTWYFPLHECLLTHMSIQVVHDWDLIAEGRIKAMTPEKADQVTLRDSKVHYHSSPINEIKFDAVLAWIMLL